MAEQKQASRRVAFELPLAANIMAIDGTWRRSCCLKEISEAGATLHIEVSIEGLALNELFLLLSSTGLVYRRCQLGRVNGMEVEVSFLRQKSSQKPVRQPSDAT